MYQQEAAESLDLTISDMHESSTDLPAITQPPIGKSDHMTVIWKPTSLKIPSLARTVSRRSMPDSAIRIFGQWITSYNWRPILDHITTQVKVHTFHEIMLEQLNKHLPLKQVKIHKSDKP